MSDFFHGVRSMQFSSKSPAAAAMSGIPFVIGAAPVHTVSGAVNKPILAESYDSAVEQLGYSSEWDQFDLCEAMDGLFRLYSCSAVVFVNVLDPKKHKKSGQEAEVSFTGHTAAISALAIKESVTVKSGDTSYVCGKDYELIYDTEKGILVIDALKDGAINTESPVTVSYDEVDPSAVTKEDIIGGFDPDAKTSSGIELVDSVFPLYRIIPDLILAPKWSCQPEVAAVMAAKAEAINTLFPAKALIDADCTNVSYFKDVPVWKNDNGITDKNQMVCWPMATQAGKRYHMSIHLAGVIAQVDRDNGDCPCESPSNKTMQADGIVLSDGTEVALDITQANFLNSMGIITALNFVSGYVAWGNYMACYPENEDIRYSYITVSRMFDWVAKSLILTYWFKVDKSIRRRLIDSIVDAVNLWLNGLTGDGKIYGGRVEFRDDENSQKDLLAGIARFHIYLMPTIPMQEIDFMLECDISYIESALAA